ncbi:interleukin-15 receptor subunit alpha [Ochotona princeps]|uniref:interleukin-15 receptor subunit alpha n=1 Tax=Ochotona princeps TaxID=9978 RepID=UPI002714FC4C|nr:interleukin-15 receptor subunit alpha [Ochotona princeps]
MGLSLVRTSPRPSGGQSKSESECIWLGYWSRSCALHLACAWASRHPPRLWPGTCRRGTAKPAAMVPRQLRSFPAHALLALLLPLAVTLGVTCPTPTSVEHAVIRVKSYNLSSRERYVCNSGFKRKAGTSSLTECVFNKTTKIAYWTTPNLKCIRDPSLAHQRPVPPSTVVTARVTPQPESPSPPGKGPAVFSPKSDTTMATGTAIVPGSWLMLSTSPSAETTGIGSHGPSPAPSQTTSKFLEPTPSISHETTGAYPHSSKEATVAISTSVSLLGVVSVVLLLLYCLRLRRTSQPPAVEMETTEAIPMTGGTSGRHEDTENYPLNL